MARSVLVRPFFFFFFFLFFFFFFSLFLLSFFVFPLPQSDYIVIDFCFVVPEAGVGLFETFGVGVGEGGG